MRFLLDLADQTDGHALTEDRYRQLAYYRADSDGAMWTPLDYLDFLLIAGGRLELPTPAL